jgi:hypothetical protein
MYLVGFSTPRLFNLISWIIRLVTRSRASHAFLIFDDPVLSVRLVLEAHSTGYRLVGLDEFVVKNRIVALASSNEQAPAGVQRLGDAIDAGLHATGIWLGARYDFKGLFGIFLALLRGLLSRRRFKNPFRSARSLFCSEAVVRTLQAGGHPAVASLDADSVGPQDLIDLFAKDPGASLRFGDIKPRRRTRQQVAEVAAYVDALLADGKERGAAEAA